LQPDLIVIDPVTDGRLDLRYLRLVLQQAPPARAVVYTGAREAATLAEVLLLDVRGFLPELATPPADLGDQLVQAVTRAIVVLGVPIVQALRTEFVATRLLGPPIPIPELDAVERQVLHELVAGHSMKAIAAALTAARTPSLPGACNGSVKDCKHASACRRSVSPVRRRCAEGSREPTARTIGRQSCTHVQ
jgi:DNA-binding NarL/FixJ family response regulator